MNSQTQIRKICPIEAEDIHNDDLDLVQTLIKSSRTRYIPIVDSKGFFVGLITHRDLLSLTVSRLADRLKRGKLV